MKTTHNSKDSNAMIKVNEKLKMYNEHTVQWYIVSLGQKLKSKSMENDRCFWFAT